MTTLSPVEKDVNFFDLESPICDAINMADVLTFAIHQHFSKAAPEGGFVIDAAAGSRLFFLASMITTMNDKVREAYYLAWENERSSLLGESVDKSNNGEKSP